MKIGSLLHLQSSRSSGIVLLFLFCWLLIFRVQSSVAGEVNLKWTVEYMRWAPDCVESVVIGINGSFPGPTIDAIAGDTINVELTNHLHTEGVVIHWHGITQKGTPWADGTASISQCAINSGETFVYQFKVEKAGTFFYHGHYGMQRSAGLYGALIVREPEKSREPFEYNKEYTLLLSDWWHQSVHRQEVELSSAPIQFIGEPQAILINGRGQFNCSADAPPDRKDACDYRKTPQCEPQPLKVSGDQTYRIRIASTTALSSLNFKIQGHQLEVVEADGNYVDPFLVDDLDIYSGESYSVLVKTNSESSLKHYWISVGVRGRKPTTPQALTILNYADPSDQPATLPSDPLPTHPMWDDFTYSKSFSDKVKALVNPELKGYTYERPPSKQDRRIVLLNTQNEIEKKTLWTINHISLRLPSTPYLGAIRYDLNSAFDQTNPPDNYSDPPNYDDPLNYDINVPPPKVTKATYSNGVFNLKSNQVIDVILQNANMLKAKHSEIHPWHLHGHDFWVLGYGDGKFVDANETTFNLINPPLRNTVVVYPYGWTALRFETDNPGVWAFHCHIEPHLHMGMGVIFAEGIDDIKKMEINKKALVCGLTGEMFMNSHKD